MNELLTKAFLKKSIKICRRAGNHASLGRGTNNLCIALAFEFGGAATYCHAKSGYDKNPYQRIRLVYFVPHSFHVIVPFTILSPFSPVAKENCQAGGS